MADFLMVPTEHLQTVLDFAADRIGQLDAGDWEPEVEAVNDLRYLLQASDDDETARELLDGIGGTDA